MQENSKVFRETDKRILKKVFLVQKNDNKFGQIALKQRKETLEEGGNFNVQMKSRKYQQSDQYIGIKLIKYNYFNKNKWKLRIMMKKDKKSMNIVDYKENHITLMITMIYRWEKYRTMR